MRRNYRETVIGSFRDDETEKVFLRGRLRRLSFEIQRSAQRKPAMLDAAETLLDLRSPPGSRLEVLSGDRVGQHSVRINVISSPVIALEPEVQVGEIQPQEQEIIEDFQKAQEAPEALETFWDKISRLAQKYGEFKLITGYWTQFRI